MEGTQSTLGVEQYTRSLPRGIGTPRSWLACLNQQMNDLTLAFGKHVPNIKVVTYIRSIIYSQGEEFLSGGNIKPLTPFTKPFYESITLVTITDSFYCKQEKSITKIYICGAFNNSLRGKFDEFISARHGVKKKISFPLFGER